MNILSVVTSMFIVVFISTASFADNPYRHQLRLKEKVKQEMMKADCEKQCATKSSSKPQCCLTTKDMMHCCGHHHGEVKE